jgi:hypothetical protein
MRTISALSCPIPEDIWFRSGDSTIGNDNDGERDDRDSVDFDGEQDVSGGDNE